MKLKIVIDDRASVLEIPPEVITDGEEFFQKMDRDMDKGWRMGPEFVENLTQVNRCQIAADKILTAVDTQNDNLLQLMAGYIVTRLPGVTEVNIDTHGEMMNTEFVMQNGRSNP